jgi:hypothetical protein
MPTGCAKTVITPKAAQSWLLNASIPTVLSTLKEFARIATSAFTIRRSAATRKFNPMKKRTKKSLPNKSPQFYIE